MAESGDGLAGVFAVVTGHIPGYHHRTRSQVLAMDTMDDLAKSLGALSTKNEEKQPSSTHKNQSKLTYSNDFLIPISVKSSKWTQNKVNIRDMKMNNGPFSKYATKHIIQPPTNPIITKPTHTFTESSFDKVIDDPTEKANARELIQDLLKPQQYPKTLVDPKDKKVDGLVGELFEHQVLGLKFLLHREKAKVGKRNYLKETDEGLENNEEETFFNNGGILADDMGLGKTVQMIALILSNSTKKKIKSTLIVCPASLVSQWASELNFKAPSLSVLTFHGPKRPHNTKVVHSFDVIITSYQTLSAENEKMSSPLYDPDYPFRRIVLDEAHLIKNRETKSHQACCNLISKKRWCLTGTPIQNKVDELYSLFKFLGVNKYQNINVWTNEIGVPLGSKDSAAIAKGLKRLHLILDKFMLRRTKQILIDNNVLTVKKTIHQETLEFLPLERKLYDKVEKRIVSQLLGKNIELNDDLNGELHKNENVKLDYLNAFSYLLRLRQLCCHWELLFNIRKEDEDDDTLFNEIKRDLTENFSEKDLNQSLEDEDYKDLINLMKGISLEENTKNNRDLEDFKSYSVNSIKIKRILNILKKDDIEKPRKTIIFSEFTSMLDILSKKLMDNSIKFVRYDGKMDKQTKADTLRKLKDDPKIHVLLCSLKCGAYGLNITSCSRVILYEPFWNPAIGAQAIDRSYRIGQIYNVDVHEFFISNSVETRIHELQDRKKELINTVVDRNSESALKMLGNGLSKKELFTLLGLK